MEVLERLQKRDQIANLIGRQRRGRAVRARCALGKALCQSRRASRVQEGKTRPDADERRHLQRATRSDVDRGIVGERRS